ncbi:MAG: phospho-N-acetylmuramoyl-pentapeptide-transferase, partial [Faecalibacterium sp.]|nr:phospho-N-acetylmuramoyl-pentapeptide-transferase [Faecalibacterium sp.]
IFAEQLGRYTTAVLVFIAALAAYLWTNCSPSTIMMGDAGGRAMGFFIAVLAMKSHHPFAYLLAGLVFILDGGLGIAKISLKRFLKIWILKNTLTPLHDHARKRKGWSDTQVVFRFVILQLLLSVLLYLLVG